jgi:hypothetical protein
MKSIALAVMLSWVGLPPNARIFIYKHKTTVPMIIFRFEDGKCRNLPLSNPAYTDSLGNITFCIPAKAHYDFVLKP